MPLAAQGEKRRLSPTADDAHDTACGSEGAKRKKHKKHKKHKKKKGSRSERLKAKAKERSKRRADSDAQGGGAGGADWDDVGREVTLLVLKATEGPFKGIKFKASSPALLLHTRALLLLARPPPPRSPLPLAPVSGTAVPVHPAPSWAWPAACTPWCSKR